MQESAADYVKFLSENKRYKEVLGAGNLQEAISAQGRTGYATDPGYAAKLAGIAGKYAGGGSVPTGPASSWQPQMASVNPATQIGTNTQPTAAGAPAPQTTEVQTGLLASMAESLAALNKTNQDQLSVQKRQLKATT